MAMVSRATTNVRTPARFGETTATENYTNHALPEPAPRYNRAPDATRRPRPAPPAPARPTLAATPPRPGARGDAASRVDRPDRRPLALRARAGARRSHSAVPREASPAAWLAPDADERRPADLDAGLP